MSKAGIFLLAFILLMTGCAADPDRDPAAHPFEDGAKITGNRMPVDHEITETVESGDVDMEHFRMENGKNVYFYVPKSLKKGTDEKIPLVLFMCNVINLRGFLCFQQKSSFFTPNSFFSLKFLYPSFRFCIFLDFL